MGTITEESIESGIKENLGGNELFAIDDPDNSDLTTTTNVNAIIKAISQAILPIGSQMGFFSAPGPNWLLNDGSAISRTTYADLFAAIGTTFGIGDGSTTFNLPDMRGQFMRGLDLTGTIDPGGSGRTLGDIQNHTMQGHWHDVFTDGNTVQAGRYSDVAGSSYMGRSSGGTIFSKALATNVLTDGVNGTPSITSENRPTNISINFYTLASLPL